MTQHVRMEACPPVGVRWHPFADLFPWLEGPALDGLREDIRQNGVREPIVFLDDAILDGRNRYQCARDLGIEYPRRDFGSDPTDGTDPLAFVVSLNLARRHLSESQRAGVAARMANMSKADAGRVGGASGHQATANLQLLPAEPAKTTTAKAAEMLNVSERSVYTARKVQDSAPPEIVRAVDDGRISVSLAAQVAELPEEAQAEVIAAPPEETREVARDVVRKAFVANNSGNNEWYTPPYILEAARAVLGGFDLDPASSEIANRAVGAATFYTAEDDGLVRDWPRGRIWINPPYASGLIGRFADRYVAEIAGGSTGICLTNNATETAWFQAIGSVSGAICFPQSRVKFLDPNGLPGAPLQGQAIFYSGPDVDAFAAAFAGFGMVVRHG